MRYLRIIALAFIVLMALASCSTTAKKKSAENVKGLKKSFHDLNARFNGYFNANLIVKESITNLSAQYKDNYNQILKIYPETAIESAQSEASNLDEAIKKSAIVISLHRPSKWVDDSYLLIGQAQYLKKEYDLSSETFDYIVKEFDPKNIEKKKREAEKRPGAKKKKKKKKKSSASSSRRDFIAAEEGKGESYFLKHRPIREEAMVWLARSYVDLGLFENALTVIRKLQKDPDLQAKLPGETAVVESYVYLKQKAYEQAVEPLKRAVELTSNKRTKTRYAYILAQIHQLQGRPAEAAEAYEYVLKLNPVYEMEFRTKLNMITNALQSGQENSTEAQNKLTRMAKDDKNEEFRDQVYFALAEINLAERNTPEAIDNLKKSLEFSVNNKSQKTESYLKLAQIYFQNEKYVFAKNYYDSTLTVISKKDERYPEVKNYSENLTDIAKQIEIIELQDSLLAVSQLSPEEQAALAKKIKKSRLATIEAEQKSATPLISPGKFNKLPGVSPGTRTVASTSKSDWWAYDGSLLKKGKKDFEKKWGTRKLEDNWRRSNRRDIDIPEQETADLEVDEVSLSESEIAQIFSDVPRTEEEVEAVHAKIADAMFLLGNLYRDRLQNERKAIETLEELQKRFSGNKHELDALYTLYVLHLDKDNQKAEYYKQQILSKYPKSRNAEILRNPEAATVLKDSENQIIQYYDETYGYFEKNDYEQANEMAVKADSLFGQENILRPKFALLSALCVGNLSGKEEYVKALNQVVRQFPNTEEEAKAKELLAYLGTRFTPDKPSIGNPVTSNDQKGMFKIVQDDPHYALVVLSSKDVRVSEAKNMITDYHTEFHNLDNLKISSLLIDMDTPILIIRRFANEAKAFEYYEGIQQHPDGYLSQIDQGYKVYPISQTNYKTLLRIRNLEPFILFFNENYE